MKDEILFQDWYDTGFSDDEDAWFQFHEEENSVNHEDEYLTSLKNYDIINM
jgi:hypothetical protein